MKYSCKTTVNVSRERFIELFDSEENMYKWQKGLKSFQVLEGIRGSNGLKSKMTYDMNGKDMEMIETIESFNFPDQMIAIYEADSVWNRCDNHFEELNGKTVWTMDNEFRFKGVMSILSIFMKKNFIRETSSSMQAFKKFAESEV